MKGNFHVQFLGEGVAATSPPYPTPWVGNHPGLPGAGTVMLLLGPPVRTKRHVQAHQQAVPDTFEPL